ncbi:MAG: hypothetical protein DRP78_05955, partial [Candidatus Omnitrophota bacterium]
MKMKLGNKLLGGFLLIASLVVIAGSIGIYMTHVISLSTKIISEEKNPIQYAAMQGAMALAETEKIVQEYIFARKNLPDLEKRVNIALEKFNLWKTMIELGTDSKEFQNSPAGKLYKEENLKICVKKGSEEIIQIINKIETQRKEFNICLSSIMKNQQSFVKYVVFIDGEIYNLNYFLYKAAVEHNEWVQQLKTCIDQNIKFVGNLAPEQSLMGKWLANNQVDDFEMKEKIKKFEKYYNKLYKAGQDINKVDSQEGKQKIYLRKGLAAISRIERGFNDLIGDVNRIYADINKQKSQNVELLSIAAENINQLVKQMVEQANKEMKGAEYSAKTAQKQANLILSIAIIIALFIAVMLGVVISRSILTVVNAVVNVAQKIAVGDLREKVLVKSGDELEDLGNNLNQMQENLSNIVFQVKSSAAQMAAATEEISSSSQQISDGAQQQSASFEEISRSVQANAQNAKSANDLSQGAVRNAKKTEEAMTNT